MAQTKQTKQTTELFTPAEIAIRKQMRIVESQIENHWANYFKGYSDRAEAEAEVYLCQEAMLRLRSEWRELESKRLSDILQNRGA